MISESEAKRAGMSVHEAVGLRSTDSAGNAVAMRVSVAHSLSVGGFELRNVAFLVARDGQQPFRDLPTAWRGVLGIPVILAFETIRRADGRFEAAFNVPRSSFRDPTMCFDGANPLVPALHGGKPVNVFLDTGTTKTRATPLFAKEFPEIMATAASGAVTVRGVGGSQNRER